MYIKIDSVVDSIQLEIKDMYKNDQFVQNFVNDIENQIISSSKLASNKAGKWDIFNLLGSIFGVQKQAKPNPAGAAKPSCSPSGICTGPKTN
jgi:hypothetical protein